MAKRHPLVLFFVLAYSLSWGNYALNARYGFPFLFPFGPLLAALIVAGATGGRAGLQALMTRCLRWRVGFAWYLAALLVPVAIALTAAWLNILLGAQAAATARIAPWYYFFVFFPLALVDAPLGEDSGWRGYALPGFSAGRSALANSLILGILVAGWHVPLVLGERGLAAPYLTAAIASAIVTNWVYYNTDGSALLAMLYHTAANTVGGAGLNLFQIFSGPDFVRAYWLLSGVNWLVVVILALAAGPSLRRGGPRSLDSERPHAV